ncbi:MlaC/ttg2D family ABC transporter substrate-binding protein [Alloalcanivorax xenomutans]|jgi:phospholipid transport system substrate-binding protein|uniref:ABC transporter substrate-binding protein n=1 Tax=Alloalcanivorax xenomutans TaxID=1094342 RepID=A0A9Q3ZFT3_9GAMM|nr:ABC transporter substrate-binding protein [Alloalcanivorax xenomutans]ERS11905.1 toluene-tolerance protein [Alcanivorax sp. PN-3]KYZ84270.1 toluene tolerance protein [Alcanivorax sp. KX64203]MBA4720491.1 ABC transporter substrate-binding protein [Alcanivorax sp.]ARB46868.1 toluene tolerance protein [Alloalcanivorax xenomutans]MCE7510061.1 ABC transporter substrate-binding protein [Alloalcanivorax xenomutans]|tara:strand:+ start:1744 stop:2388 length:645 start_codon:yes stop_codon:yes gene_type:complete
MTYPKQLFSMMAAVLLLLAAGLAQAEQDPRKLVEQTVERMTKRIDAERQKLNNDPQYARELVREELGDLVDFKRITRVVMGDYFDQASREQKYRFLEVFENSLVNTYASGVTLYDGQKMKVLPLREEDRRGNYARVRMEFSTNSGQVVPIFFTLFLDGGQWRVVNVYVNGLDLSQIYKQQFAQSMQQHNDMDTVIANWSAADVADEVENKANVN